MFILVLFAACSKNCRICTKRGGGSCDICNPGFLVNSNSTPATCLSELLLQSTHIFHTILVYFALYVYTYILHNFRLFYTLCLFFVKSLMYVI